MTGLSGVEKLAKNALIAVIAVNRFDMEESWIRYN